MVIKYKLTYFEGTGRAEVARMLFTLGNQEFEDIRVNRQTEWPELKSSMPFGQLPILEVDGLTLCQGHAINRYLARKFGYAGKTEWEQARVDMIGDCIEDFVHPCLLAVRATKPETKDELQKKFVDEHLPKCLNKFEKLLEESNSGFFVGEELTWADLLFTEILTWPYMVLGHTVNLSQYPRCRSLQETVHKHPVIAAWIAKRQPLKRLTLAKP